jgi:hypothetical protein
MYRPTMRHRAFAISSCLLFVLSASLAACGSGSHSAAPTTITSATTAIPSVTTPHASTPSGLAVWVRHMYEAGGATPAEAACLAAHGPQQISSKAEVLTPPNGPATIACAGSQTRLHTITVATQLYLKQHPQDDTGL